MRFWRHQRPANTNTTIETLLDHHLDGVLIVNSGGNIRYANRTAEVIFGRPANKLLDRPFGFPTAPGRATEAQVPRPDGSSIEVEIRSTGIEYDGEPCSLTTMRDITPAVRSRSALQEQEMRFRGIFDNAPLGMALVTLDGRWMRINKVICEMLGYAREELLRMDIMAITHPDDRDVSKRKMQQMVAGDLDRYQLRKRYLKKNGDSIHTILTVNLVRDEDEAPLYLIAHIVDISQTVETERQLQQMQKMESLGHLTGGIAHDFNNILAVVMGNLQLVQRKAAGQSGVAELAKRALAAAKRGAALTHRLLSFSQAQPASAEQINLNHCLGDLLEMVERTLGPETEIITQLDEQLWPTLVDVSQLENTILNLCINARDAMPEGGQITLTTSNTNFDQNYVRGHLYAQEGDYIALYVTDTGTGIPADIIDKIFDPFFTTKPKGKGTGLGLSSVFGFVKQSGGYMDVHSEPGHTTMMIYLPRAPQPATASSHAGTGDSIRQLEGSGRILVVDDERAVRRMTAQTLESYGYDTVEAADARQALNLLEKDNNFDLVISDVLMPGGIDGLELAQRIRTRKPPIPVILVSGFTDAIELDRNDPDIRLIAKPFADVTLLRRVHEVLDAGRT